MRIYYLLVFAVIFVFNSSLSAQGDTCSNPFDIQNLPYTNSQRTYYFQDDYDHSTFGHNSAKNPGKDVVYSFTPTQSMIVNLKVESTAGFQNNNYAFLTVKKSCSSNTILARKQFYTKKSGSYYGGKTEVGALELTAGETYHILIAAWADATGDNLNYKLTLTTVEVLPVELSDFYGKSTKDYNELTWEVASQSNNEYHILERSQDGQDWEVVDKVVGEDYSQSLMTYTIKDYTPWAETYYRIKFVDFDGYTDYSPILTIERSDLQAFSFDVFPNPFADYLIVESNRGDTQLTITNAMGNQVLAQNITTQANINTAHLPSGIYYVLVSNNNERHTYKLVKQ